MHENINQPDAMSASMGDELLRALIDKVVDNGTAIREVIEQMRKLPSPTAAAAGLDERIAALEKQLGMIGEGVGTLTTQIGDPGSRMVAYMGILQDRLEQYVNFFEKPMRKEVHHRHFLGWPVLVLFGMLVIMGVEWFVLTGSWNKEEQYERNDILWRAAMLSDDSLVTRVLNKDQREYQSGPEQFRKDVVGEEERRAELYERWLEEQKNMGKIHALEKAKKR